MARSRARRHPALRAIFSHVREKNARTAPDHALVPPTVSPSINSDG